MSAAPSDESRESSKEKNLGLLTEWDFAMPRNNRFHDPIQPQKNVVADESRERLGICQKPHFLGGTTEDRKALKQMPHFQIDGVCRDWEALVPQPNEPSKQWMNRAGELHDQIHEVAALVNMQGVEIGWAPEDAIPILVEALEKVERDTRELCAQLVRECLKLWPTLAAELAERIRGKGAQ